MNFMSTDTSNLVNACNSFHSLWSVPFQVKLREANVYHNSKLNLNLLDFILEF